MYQCVKKLMGRGIGHRYHKRELEQWHKHSRYVDDPIQRICDNY